MQYSNAPFEAESVSVKNLDMLRLRLILGVIFVIVLAVVLFLSTYTVNQGDRGVVVS